MKVKINLILPFVPVNPGGGSKVMLEYANRLSDKGYDVCLYYPSKVPYLKFSISPIFKYVYYKFLNRKKVNWFNISSKVEQRVIFKISNRSIRDADIIMSTWWSVLFDIEQLLPQKGQRYNLIQDIEYWEGNNDLVNKSYGLKNQINITIADFITDHIAKFSIKPPAKVSLGLDKDKFSLLYPIPGRELSIIMMFSEEKRKGSKIGLNAIKRLKPLFPNLKVIIFSAYERTLEVPDWVEYFYRPSDLNLLYNRSAIFITPSLFEGLGLPAMEAMVCGCAVICTNVGGHREFAVHNRNALIVPKGDEDAIFSAAKTLLEDDSKRISIAYNAEQDIQRFTWEKSIQDLITIFNI